MSAPRFDQEQLPDENAVLRGAKQHVAHRLVVEVKEDCLVIAAQPAAQPFLDAIKRQPRLAGFVGDKLAIEAREDRDIAKPGATKRETGQFTVMSAS